MSEGPIENNNLREGDLASLAIEALGAKTTEQKLEARAVASLACCFDKLGEKKEEPTLTLKDIRDFLQAQEALKRYQIEDWWSSATREKEISSDPEVKELREISYEIESLERYGDWEAYYEALRAIDGNGAKSNASKLFRDLLADCNEMLVGSQTALREKTVGLKAIGFDAPKILDYSHAQLTDLSTTTNFVRFCEQAIKLLELSDKNSKFDTQ